VKKPQWITIIAAIFLTTGIFIFGRTIPKKKTPVSATVAQHSADDGHNHGAELAAITIDTLLALSKKELTNEQVVRLNTLENSISRGDPAKAGQAVKDQQLHVYHQLARFWADSAHIFEPYAWYLAEAARLENSEKNLTFAAQLFLENLQNDEVDRRRTWKALQAKDLFERSLMINPDNDSATVGLGACYLFGNISSAPMEGIAKIRQVVDRDSSNIYGQMTLIKGSLISGQYDKAISRLQTVIRIEPDNVEAIFLLADLYERTGKKADAITWYQTSLQFVKLPEARKEIEKRIEELRK
jgi:tetratricopeptide (TPR) repeat protein